MQSTSISLLQRARDHTDREAWCRIVELYVPLLYAWGKRAGLSDADSSDLTQEVLMVLAQKLPTFVYDPAKSFRGWLKTITLNRAKNFHRAAAARPAVGVDSAIGRQALPESDIDLFERLEYSSYLTKRLLDLVRCEFRDDVWEAFRMQTLDERSAPEVAERLGMTLNLVYLAKSRVLQRLREEGSDLID